MWSQVTVMTLYCKIYQMKTSEPDEDISDHDSSDLEEPLRKEVQLKSGGVTTTMAL